MSFAMTGSCEVINLISDDEKTPVRRPRPVPATEELQIVREHIRYTDSNQRNSGSDISIRSPLRTICHNPFSNGHNLKENEVQVVLEREVLKPLKDYPHPRMHCVIHPFGNKNGTHRKRYCDNCYCCVCQIPASKCKMWVEHCNRTVPY